MSVIVAGKCKKCGKEFWQSFGTPDWYRAWLREYKKIPKVEAWKVLVLKKICSNCGPEDWRIFLSELERKEDRNDAINEGTGEAIQ